MQVRLMDEVMDLGARGVALLCLDGGAGLRPGMALRDVRGNTHRITYVTEQEGVYTLHIASGSAAYFGRLFRDVRVDATLFAVTEDAPCP